MNARSRAYILSGLGTVAVAVGSFAAGAAMMGHAAGSTRAVGGIGSAVDGATAVTRRVAFVPITMIQDGHDATRKQDEDERAEDAQSEQEHATPIQLADAPGAVRDAFAKIGGGAVASKVERIVKDHATVYEIEYAKAGAAASATFTEDGATLELESIIPVDSLPDAVRRQIAKRFPGAEIDEADAVQAFYYELDVKINGKVHEIKILANGQMPEGGRRGERENKEDHEGHADHDRDEDHENHGDHERDEDDD